MPPSPWFGQRASIQAVVDALLASSTVALTGPPGVGKSRLMAEVAAVWEGEVLVCDLAGVSALDDVVDRVAAVLALTSEGRAPVGPALAGRPGALLLLDHAESVAGELADLVESWGSGWRCLVGSRVRVQGLPVHVVGPLDAESGRGLYRQQAAMLVPDWSGEDDEIDALVAALDGLPLALELAAARVRLFPPTVLLGRLEGTLAGLDGALALSWDLLGPDAQRALSAIARVEGRFGALDFEAVTGAPPTVLEVLLDASLVRVVEPGSLELLRTVRRFALGRGQDGAERYESWVLTAVRDAMARQEWLRVEARRADLVGLATRRSDVALLLAQVRCERGPFVDPGPTPPDCADPAGWVLVRAQLLGRMGDYDRALELLKTVDGQGSVALRRYTLEVLQWTQVQPDEAAARIPAVEARLADGTPAERAEGLLAIAIARFLDGDREGCVRDLEQGRAELREEPRAELEARLLAYLAIAARPDGVGAAEQNLLRSAEIYRQLGNARREAMVRSWYGVHAHDQGELDAADVALERAAVQAGRCGDALMQAEIRGHQVDLALERGELDRAEGLLAQVRQMAGRPPVLVALMRGREGRVCQARGQLDAAARAFEETAAAFDALGRKGQATHERLLRAALGGPEAPVWLKRAQRDAESLDDVHRVGALLVQSSLDGEALDPPERPGLALRALLSVLDPGVRLAADGSWIAPRPGVREDLSAKPVLRRLARALARGTPGTVSRSTLVSATWPSERMRADSATGRLHAAVRTLRKLGLELETTELDGELAYRLGSRVRVEEG